MAAQFENRGRKPLSTKYQNTKTRIILNFFEPLQGLHHSNQKLTHAYMRTLIFHKVLKFAPSQRYT